MSSGFKAVGKLLGAGTANTSPYASEKNILNYLQNYDTSVYDNTAQNLLNNAYNMSQNLNAGNYTFNIDGSDEARQRAENATYQSYVNYLQPHFAQQTSDLETRLQNQGITVGSDAYSRAMTDLRDSQNNAYNQAAYQSVLAGQNAFSNSLKDAYTAGNFGNSAQNNYLSQIMAQLGYGHSGYENATNIYNIQSGADKRIDASKQANAQAQTQAGSDFVRSGLQSALMAIASDARLKENITPVGRLDNGLTVYLFNFIGSDVPQIGLLAQEVALVKPEAVFEDKYGYLFLRYDIAAKNDKNNKKNVQ